ncbi:hypothetical protein GCM10027605_06320 [Micromonospora zhanjiangensis]
MGGVVSQITQWTLDVRDTDRMAEFWSRVLGYRVEKGDDGCAKLYPPDDAPRARSPSGCSGSTPPRPARTATTPT